MPAESDDYRGDGRETSKVDNRGRRVTRAESETCNICQIRSPTDFARDADWRKLLTPDQYAVLRQSATERPFTSSLLHEERRGTFVCAGCDLDLFSSITKFDSGTGWPSFAG